MKKRGNLIVIEGADGVGKSTLTEALASRLSEAGFPSQAHAFPGNAQGTLGYLVHRLHDDGSAFGVGEIAPVAIQAMHIAAHLDAIERVFRPLADSGVNIVLDRYWWSTAVYGSVSGIPQDVLRALIAAERHCWGALQPLVVFLIDCCRPWRKSEDTATWHQLAREYRALAAREQTHSHVMVVKNDSQLEEVVSSLVDTVISMICDRAHRGISEDSANRSPQLPPPVSGSTPRASHSPVCFTGRLKGLKPTKVLDTYWRFAFERQEVFFRRLEDAPPPWSADPILQRYRFTNAYRASDRVSQYLIRRVQYVGEQHPAELFFRTILFKMFNRIDTWELLEQALGGIHAAGFNLDQYEKVLDQARRENKRIYAAAYVMPPDAAALGHAKHLGHLRLLERMLRDDLPERLADARSLRHAFEMLRAYPMMGDFLAFQYTIDLNYSRLLNFSEMDFVVAGPGARRGIRRCFTDLAGLSETDVIRHVTEGQVDEFARRGLAFRDLWGRPLHLIDCQNLFCEVDKYARAAHPDLTSQPRRTRIKQLFHPSGRLPVPWYPPKWNLNDRIDLWREGVNEPDRGYDR